MSTEKMLMYVRQRCVWVFFLLAALIEPSGGGQMPTYISLVNLTEQGVKEGRNAPERLHAFDKALAEVGGRLVGFYLVMGQYDYIVIVEAPDDQTAARLILSTIAQGSMRTQTMRAFPREEFEQIAKSLR